MSKLLFADFFLGANSPNGFCSLFSKAYNAADGWRAYIIKGGPGTGKSSLMRLLVQAAVDSQVAVERAFCSSDPQSLDAVIFPTLRTIVMDGTAPHVVEPQYPGVCERLVDLGQAWNADALSENRAEIMRLSQACSQCHRQAVRYLCAADAYRRDSIALLSPLTDNGKIRRCAARLRQLFPKRSGVGSSSERLLSAVTPNGIVQHSATLNALCDRRISIDDRHSTCGSELLGQLYDMLLSDGFDVLLCRCSQAQELIEHLIVPSERIGFSVVNRLHSFPCEAAGRTLHASRFMTRELDSAERKRLAENERTADKLIESACECMRSAKALHDELESYYVRAMDFSVVNAVGERLKSEIFA